MKKFYVLFAAVLFCGTCHCMEDKEKKLGKYIFELSSLLPIAEKCYALIKENKLKKAEQLTTNKFTKKNKELEKSLIEEMDKSTDLEYLKNLQAVCEENKRLHSIVTKQAFAYKKYSFSSNTSQEFFKDNWKKLVKEEKLQEAKKLVSNTRGEITKIFEKVSTSLSNEIKNEKNDPAYLKVLQTIQKINRPCFQESLSTIDLALGITTVLLEKDKLKKQQEDIKSKLQKGQSVERVSNITKYYKIHQKYDKKLNEMIKKMEPISFFLEILKKEKKSNNLAIISDSLFYDSIVETKKLLELE